jgi:hypothetical protein
LDSLVGPGLVQHHSYHGGIHPSTFISCVALLPYPVSLMPVPPFALPDVIMATHTVALVLLPSLPLHCWQHHKLASAQSQHSCNMLAYEALLLCSSSLPVALSPYPVLFHSNLAFDGLAYVALAAFASVALAALPVTPLHHCKHHAVTIASIVLALLPLSRRHLCPWRTGKVTLVAPMLLPASQTGVCSVMTQSQHVGISGGVAVLLIVAGGFVAVPDFVPQQLGLWWFSWCSAGIIARGQNDFFGQNFVSIYSIFYQCNLFLYKWY